MKLAFRPAAGHGTEDRAFVISTWSRSFKLSHSAGLISSESWPVVMHAELEKILERDGARVVIATDVGDRDFFFGWIAADTSGLVPVLLYAYVKEPYRRRGIARQLFTAIGIDPSHYFVYVCRGPSFGQLAGKLAHARYNPNEVRFPKEKKSA